MNHSLISGLNEQNLDELLLYFPDYSIQNLNNIKKLFLMKSNKKRKVSKRVAVIAAIVAIFLALSSLALAAFTTLDFGRIFNSFFNNPAAEAVRIDVGQTIVSDGFEITLLSAFVDNNKAYMMVEMRDIEDKRLSNNMMAVAENVEGLGSEVVLYDETESVATMILSLFLAGPVNEGDTITIPISSILSEISYSESGRQIENVITGSWEFSFVVITEMPERNITVIPVNETYFTKLEIECSPMTTTILKHVNSNVQIGKMIEFIDSFGYPYLKLTNDEIIILEPTGSIFDEDLGWSGYASEHFDINILHSITFCGEEYIFE